MESAAAAVQSAPSTPTVKSSFTIYQNKAAPSCRCGVCARAAGAPDFTRCAGSRRRRVASARVVRAAARPQAGQLLLRTRCARRSAQLRHVTKGDDHITPVMREHGALGTCGRCLLSALSL